MFHWLLLFRILVFRLLVFGLLVFQHSGIPAFTILVFSILALRDSSSVSVPTIGIPGLTSPIRLLPWLPIPCFRISRRGYMTFGVG